MIAVASSPDVHQASVSYGVLGAIYLCDADVALLRGPMSPARLELEALFGRIACVSPQQWDAILARKLRSDLP